ncbi:flippase-like domain-containing protein [Candidimonas sp. SYP-B2681]|uniref:lysylphosphatidylglycerol synthase transmembrane domain-containing protein n=1 Tax=Candidimonas sp. SYP-B2681 TaxID=2497686 RepID=UPI000F882789|nr:lysylphosphatidylglycerol synthase transmembrane domain-containing protein [Candidimonas sp. SYP-B2681]RTZ43189.1 flippase-like domain-containing protein [Candidimonas sp. SYP-B2681]
MRVKRALLGLLLITVLYVGTLVWVDSRNQVFSQLPDVLQALPALAALSMLSYVLRYLRWHWLLRRAGHALPWAKGFLAYLTGFAFTATPGKVGELVRIRYFLRAGVAPATVIAAFVYERAFDLIAVLLLATLAVQQTDVFAYVLAFVVIFLGIVVAVACNPKWLGKVSAHLRLRRFSRLSRITRTLGQGFSGARRWLNPIDMLVSLGFGILAWTVVSIAFGWLLQEVGISIPGLAALAIYPLAMLAGAASMLPGGVGSTEITIIALLAVYAVPFNLATLVAVGIRFATIWFSVVCGFISVAILEFWRQR